MNQSWQKEMLVVSYVIGFSYGGRVMRTVKSSVDDSAMTTRGGGRVERWGGGGRLVSPMIAADVYIWVCQSSVTPHVCVSLCVCVDGRLGISN